MHQFFDMYPVPSNMADSKLSGLGALLGLRNAKATHISALFAEYMFWSLNTVSGADIAVGVDG